MTAQTIEKDEGATPTYTEARHTKRTNRNSVLLPCQDRLPSRLLRICARNFCLDICQTCCKNTRETTTAHTAGNGAKRIAVNCCTAR